MNNLCQDFRHEKSEVYAACNTSLGSNNALSKRSKNSSITSAGTLADCRVGAPAVVVGLYEANHGEPRLPARGKRATVVHLVPEGREEGLCHRVVVTAAGVTAREPYVVFPGPRRQQPRGVLAVAVAVEDGPSAT